MENAKLFVFGLDQAGKTALLFLIRTNACAPNTKPTLGFDINKLVMKDLEIIIWDAPGQMKFRNDWGKGFTKAQLLLFILDTANKARFTEAKREFDKVLSDPATKELPLIFCFHKADLPDARKYLQKAREVFHLDSITDRKVVMFNTSIHNCEEINSIKDAIVNLIIQIKK